MIKTLLKSLQAKDLMTAKIITVHQEHDFNLVREKMEVHDIRHLPVVDDKGFLVGLITQRDLYKIHSPRKLEDGTWYYDSDLLNGFILSKVMLTDVRTVLPHVSLFDIVEIMVDHKVGCLVVVDPNNRPQGIVTRVDVLKFLLAQ